MIKKAFVISRWAFLLLCLSWISLTASVAYGGIGFTVFVNSDFTELVDIVGYDWEPDSTVNLEILQPVYSPDAFDVWVTVFSDEGTPEANGEVRFPR